MARGRAADLIAGTRARDRELAEWLEAVCESPLRFEGDCPNLHSSENHVHLFHLEYAAERHDWIGLTYREQVAETILGRWQARLRGMRASLPAGARLYVYQDMAPTVSAVAETPAGYPYPGEPTFVDSPREIMALYVGRRWSENFCPGGGPTPERIVAEVARHAGSIGKPTADALGMKVGVLRRAIEWFDLQEEVNALRKQAGRRPARFLAGEALPFRYSVYERRLAPEAM